MNLDWSTDPWEVEDPPRRSVWAVVGAPPGWPFNLFLAGVLFVGLLAASSPGGHWMPLLAVFLFLIVLGTIWLVRLVIHLLVRLATPMPFPTGFLVAPLLVVGAFLIVEVELPVRIRFEPSRASFTELAEELMKLPSEPAADDSGDGIQEWARAGATVDRRIGTFGISRADVYDHGVVLFDTTGSFFDDAGFAYFPDGDLPSGNGAFEAPDFHSLGGGWYAFTSSW